MDWAEELKMSIRKTTARKGRRAKSRDASKEASSAASSTTGATTTAGGSTTTNNNGNKDIAVDITLDLQQQNNSAFSSTSTASASPPVSSGTHLDSDARRPPRRISGGWADSGGLKTLKTKKNSFEDERFQFSSPKSITSSHPEDDIPVIPDLDDVKDEIIMNEIVEPPTVSINRVVALKELNSDLLAQNAFSAIEDVDLSILTRCLQAQDTLDEADEVWEWDKLFTDVVAEIHSDKTNINNHMAKLEIAADEIMPATMYG